MTLDMWKFVVDLGVAVGTLLLALFTWRLAAKTKALAIEGQAAAVESERQHRQQPLISFNSSSRPFI
jgi:hypothetical protein